MPTPAYLTIKAKNQGFISAGALTEKSVGDRYNDRHPDEILVQAFSHQIIIPRDPQSGLPTGQRIHKPLMITKEFDSSSPLIFTALTTAERLEFCHLEWFRPEMKDPYFSIRLEDAVIVDVQSRMPDCLDPDNAHLMNLEDVYFTYSKIIWEHLDSGTSGSDEWRSPTAR